MNTKVNFLQHFFKQNANQGFTTAGFLLRIFLYTGVVSTLFLPPYNSKQGNCNNYREGKNIIGTLNRAQQAYHFEKMSFADRVDLAQPTNPLGVVIVSNYYNVRILSPMIPAQNLNESEELAKDADRVFMFAQFDAPGEKELPNFIGGMFYSEGQYSSIICQSDLPATLPTSMPTLTLEEAKCPEGWTILN
ncbi:MAG: type IV pilin-like G/H family protein [Gomphosphaeria aponina SAG 52.96 = DSM 107014]|uniref:Type IV pilin-like G/H family protein n=1 Tax=Gomphosphaeria aponina SAG 52.96 = DSM 107014 TaxID=1521640 RepID=A0A941GMF8_9CHRO|nr:type IV pilin-like G/H family protein [Gomphosphaeria aponina SAG 52.96 = DSM 107014]